MALSQKTQEFLNSLLPDERVQLLNEMGLIPNQELTISTEDIEAWAKGEPMPSLINQHKNADPAILAFAKRQNENLNG